MKIKLTQGFINSATCPADKLRIEYCDTELPGLYLLVSPAGNAPSYFLRYKDRNGKTCHQKIGRSSDISLADARKQARTLKAEIALGSDPSAEKKARKAVLTFAEFFEGHYIEFVKPRKRSWHSDLSLYRLRLKDAFGHVKLNEISRLQVQNLHAAVKEDGLSPASADHYGKLMRRSLNYACEIGLLDTNPVAKMKLFNADNRVENMLSDQDLARLVAVLQETPNCPVCTIALFLLSTGLRAGEALQSRWVHVNWESRLLTIPAANNKGKRLRHIPLNEAAMQILSTLDSKEKYEFLFINRLTGKPYTSISHVWGRLRVKAGLPHLRIHDLRHAFASLVMASGNSLYVLQLLLGHRSPITSQRYAHLATKTLMDASNGASDIIKAAMRTAA